MKFLLINNTHEFVTDPAKNNCSLKSELSLSASCGQNLPAEKEVIASWTLAGDHSV